MKQYGIHSEEMMFEIVEPRTPYGDIQNTQEGRPLEPRKQEKGTSSKLAVRCYSRSKRSWSYMGELQ